MNGFERINRVLRGEKPDRTPIMLHNFMPAAKEAGFTMREFRSNPENMAKTFISSAEKYGLDGILVDVDTALLAYALGASADFPENEPARITGPAGKDLDEVMGKADCKRLHSDERVQIYIEAVRQMKKQIGGNIFLRAGADQGPFSLAMLVYGMEDFLADLTDDEKKEDILALIGKCYDVHLALHRMLAEAGADATSIGDSSCGPDLISREMYLTYANVFHKRLRMDLQSSGILCICHICGNLDLILRDVADVGFAGIEVDYKTDIARAHEILKGKSVLFGPIDPSGVFAMGSVEDVIKKTEEVLDIFHDGGLVIGAGCALPSITSERNIRAFVETVKQRGSL